MINYYFVFVQLQYVIFKLWHSCYNTFVQKRDLKYSIIIYSTIPLVNIFFWTTFSRRNRNFFTKKKGEKKLIGESLREEMVIRTIGKRKFHEESFSFDFFSFFFFTKWFSQLLTLSYGQFPRRLLLRITNSFWSHSIGIPTRDEWKAENR